MERLENFIGENRAAFDTETPDLCVWAAIDKRLLLAKTTENPQAKIIKMPFWVNKMRMAASVALLLCVGIAVGFYLKTDDKKNTLAKISPEHGEMERYYQQQIDKKTRQLVSLENTHEVQKDLSDIDAVMEELKTELTNAPRGSREQIIHNMISSYKAKADILQKVLDEKNQNK